jgi:hypothetical protein
MKQQLVFICAGVCCLQAAGYGKVVSHVVIGLKTVKGTKQLKLDPTIYDSLQKERVQVRHRHHKAVLNASQCKSCVVWCWLCW